MLFEQVFVILCSLLIFQTNSIETRKSTNNIAPNEPFDLLDDALTLLEALGQTVLGHILVAQDELQNLSYDVSSHSVNIQLNAEVDILQEELTLEQQVSALKELALGAGKNISSCLDGNEDKLDQLPLIYRRQMTDCIDDVYVEVEQIITGSNYAIDIIISKVQALNFTLSQCPSNDDACISDVIDQIQKASTDLPLEIGVEVDKAKDSLDIVRVKIENCADGAVAGYVQEGGDIVSEITDCVNDILS